MFLSLSSSSGFDKTIDGTSNPFLSLKSLIVCFLVTFEIGEIDERVCDNLSYFSSAKGGKIVMFEGKISSPYSAGF